MLRNSISIRNSVEGPRHDPYGVTTIDFRKNDETIITLRRGSLSGDTLFVNGKEISKSLKDDDETTIQLFEKIAGFSCDCADRLNWESGIRRVMRRSNLSRWEAIALQNEMESIQARAYYM